MKKFTFNKRLIKSNYPPLSNIENILWVEVNNVGEVIYVREYDKGDWKIILLKPMPAPKPEPEPEPKPDVIDLGIELDGRRIYFATKNLGASNPKDPGMYFAWGETEGHYVVDGKIADGYSFTKDNYKFYENEVITKYNGIDRLTDLLPEDDAATFILGKEWRIPTLEESRALIANTQTSETDTTSILECFFNCRSSSTNNSFIVSLYLKDTYYLDNPSFSEEDNDTIVEGITFKSRVTKEELYLPCAGFCIGLSIINDYEGWFIGRASYIDSHKPISYDDGVNTLDISILGVSSVAIKGNIYYGHSIRPVYNNK